MGKDKIYENYRIMSLDGSVIYKSERANSKADKLTAVKGTQLDKEKFGGVACFLRTWIPISLRH